MKKKFILVLSLLVMTSFLLSACQLPFTRVVKGSGVVVSETRDVSGFNAITLNGVGRLDIIQGSSESLEIEAEDNILEALSSEVQAGTLTLGYQESFWVTSIIPTKEIVYTLTVTDLTELTINGAGDVDIESLQTDTLAMTINGAGQVEIDDLTAETLSVQISGTATIELAGQVSSQTINIDGAGNYQAGDLQSSTASVKVQGLGNARVWAFETLTITINGSGAVSYYGSPELSQEISGLGDITHLGDK